MLTALQIIGLVPGIVLIWAVKRLMSEANVIRGPDDYWKLPPGLRPPGDWPQPITNRIYMRITGRKL